MIFKIWNSLQSEFFHGEHERRKWTGRKQGGKVGTPKGAILAEGIDFPEGSSSFSLAVAR